MTFASAPFGSAAFSATLAVSQGPLTLPATAGAFSISTADAVLRQYHVLTAQSATIGTTAGDALLGVTRTGVTFPVSCGSFSIVGWPASSIYGRCITATTGVLPLDFQKADYFIKKVPVLRAATHSLQMQMPAGQSVLRAVCGNIPCVGQRAASVLYRLERSFPVSSGNLKLVFPQSALHLLADAPDPVLAADCGAFPLVGRAATMRSRRVVRPTTAGVSMSFQPAALRRRVTLHCTAAGCSVESRAVTFKRHRRFPVWGFALGIAGEAFVYRRNAPTRRVPSEYIQVRSPQAVVYTTDRQLFVNARGAR